MNNRFPQMARQSKWILGMILLAFMSFTPKEQTFAPVLVDQVLYRVNAGGPATAAADASQPDFGLDNNTTPSSFLTSTGQNTTGGTVNSLASSVPANVPISIFTSERWDPPAGSEMTWAFPVTPNNTYEVRLYLAETFSGAFSPGARVFDVAVEGTIPGVFDDIDQFVIAGGASIGIMLSHTLVVTDSELNLEFIHGVENPAIKGIEIIQKDVDPGSNTAPVVSNPGTQNGFDGQGVSLQIQASDDGACGDNLTYGATGLPPTLSINPNTGLISGTIDGGTSGDGAYQENNGLIIIEVEDQYTPGPGAFDLVTEGTTTYLVGTSNHFGNSTAGQILSYDLEISTPGVYRFHMKSAFTGSDPTEENDSWFKIENTADVHFFCAQGNLSSTAQFETFLSGGTISSNIFYPAGNSEGRPNFGADNPGNQGAFKVFRSGGGGNKWDGQTIDFNGFPVYAYFPTAGTYTVDMSERSAGHQVDRIAFLLIDVNAGEPTGTLDGTATQPGTGGTAGASANSPYNVTVTATDGCNPALSDAVSFTWNVSENQSNNNPAAFIQVLPGAGLNSSTFGNGSLIIENTGDVDINAVIINIGDCFMPDIVYDPNGTAGDGTAKCLVVNSGGSATGYVTPTNNCVDPFSQPNNGVDGEDGYEEAIVNFTDFNPNETFTWSIDIDPTSIKNDVTAGDAGSVSGFELIGSTVTVEFADETVITTSLFDEGSLGGSQALAALNAPAAPSISMQGVTLPAVVQSATQVIDITGPANASVTLLRVEGHLYIDAGSPGAGYDLDPFEANSAIAKQLYTVTLDGSGNASVPVTLTRTQPGSGPEGGINHFIAVVNGAGNQTSQTSNILVAELDPNFVPTGGAAYVTINAGGNLFASTFGNNSFVINNTGNQNITNVTIDVSTTYMPDVVFDPVGTAGDSGAKCLTTGTAGNTQAEVGITVPADGGSDAADCESVFEMPHNGVDNNEGYDVISLDFTDFNPGESYAFGVDADPTSIQGDQSTGDAGSISGFEMIGGMVTVTFADGGVISSSLFSDGSLGGSQAGISQNTLVPPTISLQNVVTPAIVPSANQVLEVSGTPNSDVSILRIDARLYIDAGGGGFDVDPFEANEVLAVETINVTLDANGMATIPVTLTMTPSPNAGPDAGINHFIAVEQGETFAQTSKTSNVLVVEFDPNASLGDPAALVEITPGAGLGASTFSGSSFQVTNQSTGTVAITSVSIDLSTGILPDMVFDPVGAGGDATSSCLTPNSGATATGFVAPTDPCVDPFSVARNGGFDVLTIDFTDFNPTEQFLFTTDIDPNSIQGVPGAGNAGAVSGYELVGATVTVTFSDGSTLVSSLYEDGSLGGGQAVMSALATAAPSIAAVGVPITPAAVPDLAQTIQLTGTPGDYYSLLQMDSRLFIASGGAPFDVSPQELPFYANEAMSGKNVINGQIPGSGVIDIPVTLLVTPAGSTPAGGINRFMAVTSATPYAVDQLTSQTSNLIVLKYDPTIMQDATLNIAADLQGRDDNTGEGGTYTVNFYDLNNNLLPALSGAQTGDAMGNMTITAIPVGTYKVQIGFQGYLTELETITLVEGTNSLAFDELRAGDATLDNVVSALDFSALVGTFNLALGAPNYNDNADFNNDDVVSALDFSLLVSNFNTAGDLPSLIALEERNEPFLGPIDNVTLIAKAKQDKIQIGDQFEVNIYAESGQQVLDAIEAHMAFDPTMLQLDEVVFAGDLDQVLLNEMDASAGVIDLAAGRLSSFPRGNVALATLRFTALAEGATKLAFADDKIRKSEVTFGGMSVLQNMEVAELTIEGLGKDGFGFEVYPIPAKGIVNIEMNRGVEAAQVTGRIYELKGSIVFEQQLDNNGPQQIDLTTLKAGMYIIEVSAGDQVERKRIIIE